MKLQYQIFKTLNNPVEIQDLDDRKVEVHSMNQTKYLSKFASKGQFAVWASDGKDYKLLIEDGYYDVMKDLYDKRINKVWINFYEVADKVRGGLMYKIVLPMIAVSMVVAFMFSLIPALQKFQSVALIVILAVILIANMFQTNMMKKKIEIARADAINEIKQIRGKERFEEILQAQAKYYDQYFNIVNDAETNVEAEVEVDAFDDIEKPKE